jgi:hypothetical protein
MINPENTIQINTEKKERQDKNTERGIKFP